MASVTAGPGVTVPALLGLTRRSGLAGVAIGVIVTGSVVLFSPVRGEPGAWLTVALVGVAAAAVLVPGGHPLPARWTALTLAAAVLVSAGATWDPPASASGFAPWSLRATVGISALLIARGRPVAGWAASLAASGVLVAWAEATGEDVGRWALIAVRPLIALVVAHAFVFAVAWAARSVRSFHAREASRIREAASRAARLRRRRIEHRTIHRLAAPLLRRLAASPVVSAADREEARLLEAELRDLLRGARLANEPLVSAARAARRRGAEVLLFDDLGPRGLAASRARRAAQWAAGLLAETPATRYTVRLAREEPGGEPTVTFVAEGAQDRFEVLRLAASARGPHP